MTPIEFALAKAISTITEEASDIVIDKSKEGL